MFLTLGGTDNSEAWSFRIITSAPHCRLQPSAISMQSEEGATQASAPPVCLAPQATTAANTSINQSINPSLFQAVSP